MNLTEILDKHKSKMYYVYRSYSINGYDCDDLYHETIVRILTRMDTIIKLEDDKIGKKFINMAKWTCKEIIRNNSINTITFIEEKYVPNHYQFNEYDFFLLITKATNKLSKKSYEVFMTKLFEKVTPTRRKIQKFLNISDRPYQTAMTEIKDFLNGEDICPNRK